MPLKTQRCNDIIHKYKDECGQMEKLSNDDPSQSHTSFLSKLLAISKQDIQLSEDVIRAYKILMNHARKCSSGRMQFASECLLPGEADIGHAIEMEKTKEIYLEMQKSFSRMMEKLDESEQSSRIDELVETKGETKTNMYDWLDEEKVVDEEEADEREEEAGRTKAEWDDRGGEDDTERQGRVSRQNMRRQHRENIRKLREQIRESHDSKLLEIRNHMARFGVFFSDNMEQTFVGKKGEEICLITFRPFNGLVFTLDQMNSIISYSKLHAEIFCNFISMAYLIKSQESLSGVTTADCVNTLKRISTRNYLMEILRCPSCKEAIAFILLTNPSDHVLNNLDHLARIDPYLFCMLLWAKEWLIPFNEQKNIAIDTNPLFKICELKPPHKFQFVMGSISKALRTRIEKNESSFLPSDEFNKVYNIVSKTALSMFKSGASTAGITIPIDTPNQTYANVHIYEDDGTRHQFILPCDLKEDNGTIQVPRRYQSIVDSSLMMYIPGISTSRVRERDTIRVSTYLYKDDRILGTRSTTSTVHEYPDMSQYSVEFV